MANVVVAMYRFSKDALIPNSMPPFYEALLKGLKDNGNHVLCVYHDIYGMVWDDLSCPEFMMQKIAEFSPDAFILFNYEFFDYSKEFNVPFIVYDVDSPNRYQNKTAISKQPDRYKFAVLQECGGELIKNFYSVKDDQIRYIKPFTAVKNRNSQNQSNIGFCGSHWLWRGCESVYNFMKMKPTTEERKMALEVLERYKKFPYGDTADIYEQCGYKPDRMLQNQALMLAGRLSGLKRAAYLSCLVDLGLEIRGEFWNHPSLNFFPEVALCYNPEPTVTVFENESFYNSLKIGFNINHIQAQEGFSWRVCDILASNACLVSEYTPGLAQHFSKLGIPMYTSKEEARELCVQLLKDESRRNEIVAASNELIEKEYRFRNILGDLEELCGISLSSDDKGSIEYLNLTNYLKPQAPARALKTDLSFAERVERKVWNILGQDLKKKKII